MEWQQHLGVNTFRKKGQSLKGKTLLHSHAFSLYCNSYRSYSAAAQLSQYSFNFFQRILQNSFILKQGRWIELSPAVWDFLPGFDSRFGFQIFMKKHSERQKRTNTSTNSVTLPGDVLICLCQSQNLRSENVRSDLLAQCNLTRYPPTSKVQRHSLLSEDLYEPISEIVNFIYCGHV